MLLYSLTLLGQRTQKNNDFELTYKDIMINPTDREFYVIIERDEDGYYVGEVPQLQACYSQGETIDELMDKMKEVIEHGRRSAIRV